MVLKSSNGKRKNIYFDKDCENLVFQVKQLIQNRDIEQAKKLFDEKLYSAFSQMCLGIINRYKFFNIAGYGSKELVYEGLIYLWENIANPNRGFDPFKGSKAYSYYSVILVNFYKDLYTKVHRSIENIYSSENIDYEVDEMTEDGENFGNLIIDTSQDLEKNYIQKKERLMLFEEQLKHEVRKRVNKYHYVKSAIDYQIIVIIKEVIKVLSQMQIGEFDNNLNWDAFRFLIQEKLYRYKVSPLAFSRARTICNALYQQYTSGEEMISPNILALDISTTTVGYAVFNHKQKLMDLGYIDLSKKNSIHEKADIVLAELFSVIDKFNVGYVVVEDYITKFSCGRSNSRSITVLAAFNHIIRYLCYREKKLESSAIAPITVKSITGMSKYKRECNIEDTKDAARKFVIKDLKSKQGTDLFLEKMNCQKNQQTKKNMLQIADMADAYLVGQAWFCSSEMTQFDVIEGENETTENEGEELG